MKHRLRRAGLGLACAGLWLVSGPARAADAYTTGSVTWDTDLLNLAWGPLSGGPYTLPWLNGDKAFFEGTAGTITIGVGGVTANALDFTSTGFTVTGANTLTLTGPATVDVVSAGTATISAIIGGSAGLTKNNTGTLELSGANTFGATTTINAGTIVAGNIAALGAAGNLVQISTGTGAGTLNLSTDTSVNAWNVSMSSSNPGTLVANKATAASAGITHALGSATLGNNTLNVTAGANVSGGAPAVSFSSLNLSGGAAGTLTLNPTTANLVITGATNIGSNSQPKTLDLGGTATGGSITGLISDGINTLSLTKSNTGTWTLGGGSANTFTGNTTVSAGTLTLNKTAGFNAVSSVVNVTGGTLNRAAANQIPDAAVVTTSGTGIISGAQAETIGTLNINSTGANILSGLNVTGATTITAGTAHDINSGSTFSTGALAMSGSSALRLGANSSATTVNIGAGGLLFSGAGGTLQLGQTGAAPTALVNLSGDITSDGTSAISNPNTTGPRLLDLQGATRTVTVNSGTLTIQPTVQNGGITKNGAGTLVLSGTSTYTGGTAVNAGVLSVSADANLGGTGVSNPVTLNGGTLRGGAANITLHANHGLVIGASGGTVNGGSTGNINFIANASQISGSGTLTITGGSSTTTALQINAAQPGLSGPISINSGRVHLNNAAATLGSGAVTVGTGTASLFSSANVTLANNFNIQSNGGENRGALRFTAGGTLGGTLTLLANAGISSESATAVTLNGNTGGAFTLQLGGLTGSSASAIYNLNGSNSHSGTTLGNGTLNLGTASALGSSTSTLTVSAGTVNLNAFSPTVGALAAGAAAGTITDNAAGTGTSTLTVANQGATTVASLIKDGTTREVAVNIANTNSGVDMFTGTSANTFSGGLTLLHNATGTRLRIGSVTTVGTPGAITSSPFGTGPIIIGQAATDKAGLFFVTAGQTVMNEIVANTALGTDRPGIRSDATNITLSGKLTANLAPLNFSTNGTGSFNLTGQVTGTSGITLDNGFGTTITVNLNNAGTPNDYAGATTIAGNKGVLNLNAANQIPNGAGKGNVVNNGGILNLNGNSETINGLSGTGGFVDGISGTPTLTLGDNNATASYAGVIRNTAGTLSLVKIGTGTQTLSGANTYSGSTDVNAGILTVANNAGLGATAGATSVASNAALTLASGVTVTGETLTINGSGANSDFAGALRSAASATWAGPVILGDASSRIGAAAAGTLTVSGAVTGGNPLYITGTSGTGSVVLSAASGSNTYAGPTAIIRGNLRLGADNTLPTTTVLDVDYGGAAENSTFDLNGFNQTVGALQRTGTGSGAGGSFVTNTGVSKTLTVNQAVNTTYDGVISGAANLALTKSGSGQLTLSGVNTYTGATTISAGTLALSGGAAIADTSAVVLANTAGAVLRLNASETVGSIAGGGASGGNIDLQGNILTSGGNNTSTSYSGIISGTGGLTKIGSGALTLSGPAANTYTGLTTVSAGTLNVASANALGTTAGGTVVNGSNGTTGSILQLTSAVNVAEPLTLAGSASGRARLIATAAGAEWSGPITLSTTTNHASLETAGAINGFTVSGNITGSVSGGGALLLIRGASTGQGYITGDLNFTGGLFKTDSGTWTIGDATPSTYNWSSLGVAVGTLRMGAAGVLPAAAPVTMGQSGTNSANLDLNGFDQTVSSLTINAANTAGTQQVRNDGASPAVLTVANSAPASFGNTVGSTVGALVDGTSTLGLTKTGSGTFTLVGGNIIYTGPTTINAGALQLSSTTGFASSIANSALLQLGGSSNWSFGNPVSGSGNLQKVDANTVTLTAPQPYTGKTIISQGTLEILNGNEAVLGAPAPAADALFLNGGTLRVAGTDLVLNDPGRGITVGAGNGTIEVSAAVQLTIAEDILANGVNLNKTGAGTLNLTQKATAGTFTLQGGTVTLQGGTLRFDNFVQSGGVFDWSTGSIGVATTSDDVGTTDFTSAGYHGVQAGFTANYGANLTSQPGSSLLLHGSPTLYLNAGVRFNNLAVAGDFDLSAAGDLLEFDLNPYLLRPFSSSGTAAIEYGSLPLVTWTGTQSGTFDAVTGIGVDNFPFALSTFAVTTGSALDVNTYFLEYDAAAQTLWFHYKVSGYVPEPGTFGMVAAGAFFLRLGRRLRAHRQRVSA